MYCIEDKQKYNSERITSKQPKTSQTHHPTKNTQKKTTLQKTKQKQQQPNINNKTTENKQTKQNKYRVIHS